MEIIESIIVVNHVVIYVFFFFSFEAISQMCSLVLLISKLCSFFNHLNRITFSFIFSLGSV